MIEFTKEDLHTEFVKLLEEKSYLFIDGNGPLARYARRFEAMKMVESYLSLQELVADINDYRFEMYRRSEAAIAKYLREKHGIKMTEDDIWDIVYSEVFEDKECEGELWMNGISNDMNNFHEGKGKKSLHSPLSAKELAKCVTVLFEGFTEVTR